MRLNVLPVHLPDAICGLGFLEQPRVSFRFVPLHYCELRQQAISTEAKPNEQVGVEAAFWELSTRFPRGHKAGDSRYLSLRECHSAGA